MRQGPGVGLWLSVSMRLTLELDDELPSLSRLSPGKSHYKAPGPGVLKMAGYEVRGSEDADARSLRYTSLSSGSGSPKAARESITHLFMLSSSGGWKQRKK